MTDALSGKTACSRLGSVDTELDRAFRESEAGKAMIKRVAQRWLGHPGLLLARDGSGYMAGPVIAVDGGHLVGLL